MFASCAFLSIYMPPSLDCLFSSRLLVLSTCFVFGQVFLSVFPDSLCLVVVSPYLLSRLPGLVWQASCCFPPHLLWWPLTAHLSRNIFTWHFSPLPGEFFLFLFSPYISVFLTYSLQQYVVTPLLLLNLAFLLLPAASLSTSQPCLLVVFPTVSHLFLFHFTLLLSPLPVPHLSSDFLPPTPFPRLFLFILFLIFPSTLSHATTTICSWHPHLHTSLPLLSFLCLRSVYHLLPSFITHSPIS